MPYDGPPVEEIAFPVIDLLPVLPYWPVYEDWAGHLGDCYRCNFTMSPGAGGTEQITDLCPSGRVLMVMVRSEIDEQHLTAQSN